MTREITEAELRSMKKVRPIEAALYLGNTWTANRIRVFAQADKCPFCMAGQNPGSKRYFYVINVERLIQFKEGKIWAAS